MKNDASESLTGKLKSGGGGGEIGYIGGPI